MKNIILIVTIISFYFSSSYKLYSSITSDDVSSRRELSIQSVGNARSSGLAGISFAAANDSYALFENASMLSLINYGGIVSSYSYSHYGSHEMLLGYAYIADKFSIGVGIKGLINEVSTYSSDYLTTSQSGQQIYYQTSLTVAGSYKINANSAIGLSLEGVYTETSDYGIFASLTYATSVFLPSLRLSAGIEDFGFYQDKFLSTDTKLALGVSMMPEDEFFTAGFVVRYALPSMTFSFGIGGEIMILRFNSEPVMDIDDYPEEFLDAAPAKSKPNGVKLRLGFTDKDFSVGTGISFYMIKLDYAFTLDYDMINNMKHTISISALF